MSSSRCWGEKGADGGCRVAERVEGGVCREEGVETRNCSSRSISPRFSVRGWKACDLFELAVTGTDCDAFDVSRL